jgi:hypothetical protein
MAARPVAIQSENRGRLNDKATTNGRAATKAEQWDAERLASGSLTCRRRIRPGRRKARKQGDRLITCDIQSNVLASARRTT